MDSLVSTVHFLGTTKHYNLTNKAENLATSDKPKSEKPPTTASKIKGPKDPTSPLTMMFALPFQRRRSSSASCPHSPPDSECIRYDAPQTLTSSSAISSALQKIGGGVCIPSSTTPAAAAAPLPYAAPTLAVETEDDDDECPVCLTGLSEHPCMRIQVCSHVFHQSCLQDCVMKDPTCPLCRTDIPVEPQGTSPSGTMKIRLSSNPCPGFGSKGSGSIELSYLIPNGIQSSFHPNPGTPFEGDDRPAFLPDTHEGRLVLTRFKYAFRRGLMFTIGTSATSGKSNVVVWLHRYLKSRH